MKQEKQALPLNTTAWIATCRKQCANTISNTAAGHWLDTALRIIEQQYHEIQAMRNEQIGQTSYHPLPPSTTGVFL